MTKTLFMQCSMFLLSLSMLSNCYAGRCNKIEDLSTYVAPKAQEIRAAFSRAGQGQVEPAIRAEDLNEFGFIIKSYAVKNDGTLDSIYASSQVDTAYYKTIYSFVQYKTISDNDNKKAYGVSIDLSIDIVNNSYSAATGSVLKSIFSLAAKHDKFDSTISLSVHGMKSSKAAFALPISAKLNEDTATQYLNYMGILKTMISEENIVDPVELSSCILFGGY